MKALGGQGIGKIALLDIEVVGDGGRGGLRYGSQDLLRRGHKNWESPIGASR